MMTSHISPLIFSFPLMSGRGQEVEFEEMLTLFSLNLIITVGFEIEKRGTTRWQMK
jgi:hypothetical protein